MQNFIFREQVRSHERIPLFKGCVNCCPLCRDVEADPTNNTSGFKLKSNPKCESEKYTFHTQLQGNSKDTYAPVHD